MANTDLFTHMAHFHHAVNELPNCMDLLYLLHSHDPSPAGLKKAATEALAEYSQRVARHSDAIYVLTENERTKALVTEFSDLVSLELSLFLGTAENQARLENNRSVVVAFIGKIAQRAAGAADSHNRLRLVALSEEIRDHLRPLLYLQSDSAAG